MLNAQNHWHGPREKTISNARSTYIQTSQRIVEFELGGEQLIMHYHLDLV